MNRRVLSLAAVCVASLAHFPRPALAAKIVVTTSAELQAALDSVGDGGVVEIRAGTYSAVNADGDGGGFRLADRSNVTLRAKGEVILDGGGDVTCLSVTGVDGLTIKGVGFRNSPDDGLNLDGVSRFRALRCSFTDIDDSGIQDADTNGYRVDRCTFTNCDYALALGYGSQSTGVLVRRSSFVGCDMSVDLWANAGRVESNSFEDCETGVNVQDNFSGALVRKNRFEGGTNAIISDGVSNTIFLNEIIAPSGRGIDLRGDGSHVCDRNRISAAGSYGIYVNSEGNDIRRNVTVDSVQLGLGSRYSQTSSTYTANSFDSAQYDI